MNSDSKAPTTIPREWQQSDIRYWFAANETCPNCGIVLRDMHPLYNLYPHWTGAAERNWSTGHDSLGAR